MATYILTCDHEASECAAIEEELQRLGPAEVIQGRDFYCSCPYGKHAGWVAVEAENAESVLASLPPVFRTHAQVHQVETVRF